MCPSLEPRVRVDFTQVLRLWWKRGGVSVPRCRNGWGQMQIAASDNSNSKVEQNPLFLSPRTPPTQDCPVWWLLLDMKASMVYVWPHHTEDYILDLSIFKSPPGFPSQRPQRMALLLFLWLVQSKSISTGRHFAFSLSGSIFMSCCVRSHKIDSKQTFFHLLLPLVSFLLLVSPFAQQATIHLAGFVNPPSFITMRVPPSSIKKFHHILEVGGELE